VQPKPQELKKKMRAFRPSPRQGKRGGGDNKEEQHYSTNKALSKATETKRNPNKKLRALRPSPCQGKRGGGDNKEEPHDSRNNALWTQLKPPGTSRCNRTPQDPQKKTAQKITRFWMQPKPLGTSKKIAGVPAFSLPRETRW